MTSRLTLPAAPQSIRLVPASDKSAVAKAFAEGVAYAERAAKVDQKGRPLHRFDALVEYAGARLGTVSVETPQPLPESVPLGAVYQPVGQTSLTVANARDAFDLRITLHVEGYEPVKG